MNTQTYTQSNEKGRLPPGWRTRFSKSHPGKRIYTKCTTQWKRPEPETMRISEPPATIAKENHISNNGGITAPVLESPVRENIPPPVREKNPEPNYPGKKEMDKYNILRTELITKLKEGKEVLLDEVGKLLDLKNNAYAAEGMMGVTENSLPPPWVLEQTPFMEKLTNNQTATWTDELKDTYYKKTHSEKVNTFFKELKKEAGITSKDNTEQGTVNWIKLKRDGNFSKFKNAIISELKAGKTVSRDVIQMLLDIKDYSSNYTTGGKRNSKKQRAGAVPPPWVLGQTPFMEKLTTNKNTRWTDELKDKYYKMKKDERIDECYEELQQTAGVTRPLSNNTIHKPDFQEIYNNLKSEAVTTNTKNTSTTPPPPAKSWFSSIWPSSRAATGGKRKTRKMKKINIRKSRKH
jgi:hypothetical protein